MATVLDVISSVPILSALAAFAGLITIGLFIAEVITSRNGTDSEIVWLLNRATRWVLFVFALIVLLTASAWAIPTLINAPLGLPLAPPL